tara:strand:+ start:68 stop:1690 length:1623 start_codon:yes stop_codon:yes gene_type:complete
MAVSKTDRNESLQCIACAVRQSEGSDITERELINAILDWGENTLEPKIENAIGIENTIKREITSWVSKSEARESPDKDYDNWIKSSVLIANELSKSTYIDSSGYKFYRQDQFPNFKDKAFEIATNIKKNTSNSVMKQMYNASVGSGWKDKWNPSDILAVKSNKVSNLSTQLSKFDATKVSRQSAEIRAKNKENRKLVKDNKAKKQIQVMEELDTLYEYNKLINDLCDSKECVGISLKLQLGSSSVPIKKFDHKDVKGLKDAMLMEVKIDDIEWKPSAAKAIINFSVGDDKVLDDNWFLDVRGTESGKTSLGGVQINLMYKGGTTAHGKASIAVFSMITKLSGGLKSLKAQHRKKQELFGDRRVPLAAGTLLTDHMVFESYISGGGSYLQNSFGGLWRHDLPLWLDYIDFLTTNKVARRDIIRQFREAARFSGETKASKGKKTKEEWARLKIFKGQKQRRGGDKINWVKLRQALKYLKNKIQAYEVAYVFDKDNQIIKEAVRENIMKGVYSYAGSQGFRIFTDKGVTDFMTASSYVKVGGL